MLYWESRGPEPCPGGRGCPAAGLWDLVPAPPQAPTGVHGGLAHLLPRAQGTSWEEDTGMAASWERACNNQSVLHTGEDKSAEEIVEADV